jgi:hypothetical protein
MPDAVDAFLAHHFAARPVDATFVGIVGHDHRLPRCDRLAIADERRALEDLAARLAAGPGDMDHANARAEARHALLELELAPRQRNPAWVTGEGLFAILSLLLPQSEPVDGDAVAARLVALPDFLADARALHAGEPAFAGAVQRARREAAAAAGFLRNALHDHPAARPDWRAPAETAARAFESYSEAIADLPDRDPARGRDHLEVILREVHALPFGVDEALRRAEAAFERIGAELRERAARIDPATAWPDQIARLAARRIEAAGLPQAFERAHRAALAGAGALVTPAADVPLSFPTLAPWFREIAARSYFLSYRCPPARERPNSVYWVPAWGGMDLASLKSVHAIHHGSIGHHTQNARARAAASRFGRVAGTDAATGITFLSAGTMVEGWSCHAQALATEIEGFHDDAEKLLVASYARRNAASVLVDLRLHLGAWSLAEAARFYREEAGFAPERVDAEITRNAMFPGSRAMYWLGTAEIEGARARWPGTARDFHDRLIGQGHVPVRRALAAIGAEVA